MAGMTRRHFLRTTAALSAGLGLSYHAIGSALAAPLVPAKAAPSTLLQTVRQRTVGNLQYRTLVAAPGEPYVARLDLLGKQPSGNRAKTRRSLVYLGHLSDIHIMDAQSPARVEPLLAMSASTWSGSARPQDTLTVHVLSAMVTAVNALQFSPVTGAPVTAVVNTGDMADMFSTLELRWYIDLLDGKSVTPNSGAPKVYEGMQAWLDTQMIYHPEDPGGDAYGEYGFPRIPGLLNTAVGQNVSSQGLAAPWYAVYGNHDTLYYGFFPVDSAMRSLALGTKKPYQWEALGLNYLAGWARQQNPLARFAQMVTTDFGMKSGFKSVTADSGRQLIDQRSFMAAHLDSPAFPGPVGHGFTQNNLDTGQTYWAADVGSRLRVLGLDTCNAVVGADGAVPQDQFDWLKTELAAAAKANKLAIVISHHNSLTLENTAVFAVGPAQPLIHADEFIAMLHTYPNMVAWLNGHTHNNTIFAHRNPNGTGGFWEITAASCIDFPQQQQMVEIVDNRDGTLSLFTTAVDHASTAEWTEADFSQVGLASLSRQLASNDFTENPLMRRGAAVDRNTELLVPAPLDLSGITDAELEAVHAEGKARIARRMAKGQS
ncbi:MAG: TIGR03767 family metallophosphoesterase [Actinomycetes bacterium]